MTKQTDQPHYEHPDVAGETQAWCSKCERDADDCTCDSVCNSDSAEANTQDGQADWIDSVCKFGDGDISKFADAIIQNDNFPVPVLAESTSCREASSDEARESISNQPSGAGIVALDSRGGENSFDDGGESCCEWFDNLPKPPEPLPWLPQKKAKDRHPFA